MAGILAAPRADIEAHPVFLCCVRTQHKITMTELGSLEYPC